MTAILHPSRPSSEAIKPKRPHSGLAAQELSPTVARVLHQRCVARFDLAVRIWKTIERSTRQDGLGLLQTINLDLAVLGADMEVDSHEVADKMALAFSRPSISI